MQILIKTHGGNMFALSIDATAEFHTKTVAKIAYKKKRLKMEIHLLRWLSQRFHVY